MINVCLCCDDKYSKYAGVVVASILNHANAEDCIQIYIISENISEKNKKNLLSLRKIKDCNICFVEAKEEDFSEFKKIQTHAYISLPTFFRLKLTSLLPNVQKVLYLDCDVIVNASLKYLFEIDLSTCWAAGVPDIDHRKTRKNPKYFNAGVLLVNLDAWRQNNVDTKLSEYVQKNWSTISLGDQEILNNVLYGHVKMLDEKWNVQSSNFVNRSSYTDNPNIVHFTGQRKPWQSNSLSVHRELYFENLQSTPWKLSPTDYQRWKRYNSLFRFINYLLHRPLFFLRPRFYKVLYLVYLRRLSKANDGHTLDSRHPPQQSKLGF